MGTNTPLAVLSGQPKLLLNYFKRLFARVTNPPIDPLREGLVMSLMAFTGKQRNLLDERPEHCRQLKLPHPILSNGDVQRLRTVQRQDFKAAWPPRQSTSGSRRPGADAEGGSRKVQGGSFPGEVLLAGCLAERRDLL